MGAHVAVVGGGITGVAVARDLAGRGAEVTLVERGSLAAGTSGRNHGLLHSGARYADSEESSARDCLAERNTVAAIAPHCVEAVDGLIASLPSDEPGYLETKREACVACDIPVELVDGETARSIEPGLSAEVTGALRVPSATVDPVRLTVATAASAAEQGAEIRTDTAVVDLELEAGRVTAVVLQRSGGEKTSIETDHVVNAAGAWAGRVANLAGVELAVVPVGGACTAIRPRTIDTVVHRARPRGEGDIAVPHGETTLLGTTAQPIDDPDDFVADPEAAGFLRDELADLVPAVSTGTEVRTFAGLRPLLADAAADPNAASRDFRVIDHRDRDGVAGLTSVVGGKLTTHRLMAEECVDRIGPQLGLDGPCRTAAEPLVGVRDGTDLDAAIRAYGPPADTDTTPW